MSKSAFAIVAQRHQEMGSPGLLRCIQVLGDNFDELDVETQNAYETFYCELMDFVNLQNS